MVFLLYPCSCCRQISGDRFHDIFFRMACNSRYGNTRNNLHIPDFSSTNDSTTVNTTMNNSMGNRMKGQNPMKDNNMRNLYSSRLPSNRDRSRTSKGCCTRGCNNPYSKKACGNALSLQSNNNHHHSNNYWLHMYFPHPQNIPGRHSSDPLHIQGCPRIKYLLHSTAVSPVILYISHNHFFLAYCHL